MKTKIICSRMAAWLTLGVCLALRQSAFAQFPALGDDNTQSLGQFRILVFTNFQAMMVGNPNYSAGTHIFTSPVLYDANTIIGRSGPLQDGSAGDIAGVAVGTAGTLISESNLFAQPGGLGPVGTREVHTELRAMNMKDFGSTIAAVRGGTNAVGRPISAGEVESHSGATGLPANDFPATSFFDVFAQVDVPGGGGTFPGATNLYNDLPLLVLNTNITSFPPQVIYIHGMSTAVPIKFSNNNPPLWSSGQIFGLLQLAGHDVTRSNSAAEQANLINTLNTQIPAPVEPQYSNQVGAPVTIASTNMIFPVKGDDITQSLGTFELVINPAFQSAFASPLYPGYNATSKRLISPLLFDPSTKIGRSAPLNEGTSPDTNGVLVGTANTLVKDSSFALVPTLFDSQTGTFEVHTEVRTLNLSSGTGFFVRAGTAATGSPGSYGSVNALSGPNNDAYWDFPAKSFFDVFVQVSFPANGTIPAFTVTNKIPLVVQNNNLTQFPPSVIYVHGNTTAVPVMFTAPVPTLNNAQAGDVLGILTLAGHGINFAQTNSAQVQQFQQAVQTMTEMPVDPQYSQWAPGLNVPLQIAGFQVLSSTIQIAGYCTANTSLKLQSTTSLIGGPIWVDEVTTTGTTNSTFFVSTTKGNSNVKFYRMVDVTR
jgi:hypothetical protein